jgi:hypothetical protein
MSPLSLCACSRRRSRRPCADGPESTIRNCREHSLRVDGNPLEDVKVVGELENLRVIIKDGRVYKNTL